MIKKWLPLTLTLIMLPVLLTLGFWQLDRLAWKEDLLQRIAEKNNTAPIGLTDRAVVEGLTRDRDNYAIAKVRGEFLHSYEQLWFAAVTERPPGLSASDKVGFHVLTPLRLADQTVIYVDRGFIPDRLKDPSLRPNAKGEVNLTVRIRWPDLRGRFDAPDKPSENLWYVKNPAHMAELAGFEAWPFLLEQVAPQDGWPYAGQSRISLPNRHLEYAVTWFGFAAILVIISILWHIRNAKQSRRTDPR